MDSRSARSRRVSTPGTQPRTGRTDDAQLDEKPFRRLLGALRDAVAASAHARRAAEEKKEFKVAWSIYVGWMPWDYAAEAGIVKKWADKYGIKIDVVQINDYVESINQYTAGKFDG